MGINFDNDLLLITCASGKQARAILHHVAPQWKRLRLQCASESSAQKLKKEYPNADVVQWDFSQMSNPRPLLEGVAVCLLILPPFHPRESQLGLSMIDAAVESGRNGGPFRHLVYSSVLHPIIRAMVNHDSKRYVEEALVESGLNYTVVQPTHIMDNISIKDLAEQDKPVYKSRYNPDTKFSYLCLADLGEAVANILREGEAHYFATYQLVSTSQPMNYREAMQIVSEEIKKPVHLYTLPIEESIKMWRSVMMKGRPEAEKAVVGRGFARMLVYYETQGLIGNPSVLRMLLRREPIEYRDWVRLQFKQ